MKLRSLLRKQLKRNLKFGALVRNQQGFTLIEILVAVAILSVIAVAFLSALSTGYLSLVLADKNTIAESLTRTEFENIRKAGYPIILRDPADPDSGNYDAQKKPYGSDLYVVDIQVTELGDGTSDRPIQLITVQVSHLGEEVLTTQTYIADPNKNYL